MEQTAGQVNCWSIIKLPVRLKSIYTNLIGNTPQNRILSTGRPGLRSHIWWVISYVLDYQKEVILRQGNSIFIKRNFRFVKIDLSEILYLEADGNYVHVVLKDKKFTVRLSLMQVMQKINYSRFARINRSSVVNVDAIQSFNKDQVEIAKYEIPIGKSYKESFFRQLGFR